MIEGYENACKKALEILPECVCSSAKDLHDVNEATSLIRTAVASKQYGNEDFLANLIAQACGELAIQSTWAELGLSDVKTIDFALTFIVYFPDLLFFPALSGYSVHFPSLRQFQRW